MTKVSFVKWSLKWIFVYRSAIYGIPKYFENCCFQCDFKIWGRPQKGSSVHKNQFLRPLYNRYFCHITIVKWSRIIQKSSAFFEIFLLQPLFPFKFPTVTLKIYQHQKEKSYRGLRDSFGNGMTIDQGNNLGGCRSCYCANPKSNIALVGQLEPPPLEG